MNQLHQSSLSRSKTDGDEQKVSKNKQAKNIHMIIENFTLPDKFCDKVKDEFYQAKYDIDKQIW